MAEAVIVQASNKLESALLSHAFSTYHQWTKSGSNAWNSFVNCKKILEIPDDDQSARLILADLLHKVRFGLCSLNQRFPDAGLRIGWSYTSPTPETVDFSDDFATDLGTPDYDTAKWDVLGSPTSLVISGGELTITQSSTGGLKSDSTFNLQGKAMSARVPIVESNGNITNGFILAPDDSLSSYIAFDEYAGNLRFTSAGSGNSTSTASITYNATDHLYKRVRFASVGNNIYFDTSPDGTTWTQRATGVYTQSKTLKIYLRNYVAASGKVSKFSNVKIATPATASKLHAIVNNAEVYECGETLAEGNELRVQIISESGSLVAKFYWRESTEDSEELKYTSTLTDANLRSYFPLICKGEIFTDGGILRNLQIETTDTLETLTLGNVEAAPQSFDYPLIYQGLPMSEVQAVIDYWLLDMPNRVSAVGKLITSYIPKTGIITEISVLTPGVAVTKEVSFDIHIDGESILEEDIVIDNANPIVDIELNLEVEFKQKIEIYCTDISSDLIVQKPIAIRFKIEEE